MMTQNDFIKMARECLGDDSDRLTAWEIKFLDEIVTRYNRQWFELSTKQCSTVEGIWNKLFA
jgi:hypothetical protein